MNKGMESVQEYYTIQIHNLNAMTEACKEPAQILRLEKQIEEIKCHSRKQEYLASHMSGRPPSLPNV